MGIEELSQFEIYQGSLSLVFVILSIILGLRIISKYFSLNKIVFVTIGLTWIFLTSGWWGSSFAFLLFILFNIEISPQLYIFLENGFVPLALILWIYSFTTLVYSKIKKQLLSIYLVLCVVYEMYLIYFSIVDYTVIAIMTSRFNSEHNNVALIFTIFAILTAILTGILFVKESMKSEDKKVRLKGKFLLLAFILFTGGALVDVFAVDPIGLFIARIILVISAFSYYLGFLIPDRLANIFVK